MIILEFSHVDKNQNCIVWTHEKSFKDVKEAKAHLKENYPYKRNPMYVDMKDGSTKKVGYVYSRKDKYEDTHKTFVEEIWVSFHQQTPLYL